MKANDPRAKAWRESVNEELINARLSRRQLALQVGISPQRMSQWLGDHGEYAPPDPDMVFAIEDALGVHNKCAAHLGYMRAPGTEPASTVDAIRQDPLLSRQARDTLLFIYHTVIDT
jgi:transcriptional regulator with XRE-family HTH domain